VVGVGRADAACYVRRKGKTWNNSGVIKFATPTYFRDGICIALGYIRKVFGTPL
jgi:hypothetical protein